MKVRTKPLLAVVLAIGLAAGFVVRDRGLYPAGLAERVNGWFAPRASKPLPGRWEKAPDGNPGAADEKDLTSIGYASGTHVAGREISVTVHDKTAANAGYNVFTSGHAPEAVLMDMDGHVLHRWSIAFDAVWPGRSSAHGRADYWRRGQVFADGRYLAIFDQLGLVELDRKSNVLWSKAMTAHHDLQSLPDGRIFVLTFKMVTDPELRHGEPTRDDEVTILADDGTTLDSVPLVEALRNSNYATLLERAPNTPDVLHTNSIEVFGGECEKISPLFRRGNVLVSFRALDAIAIVDMEARRVVWALTGLFKRQHDPTLTSEGRMLVFDNQGLGDFSRVLEFDPLTQQVSWSHRGDAAHPFYSQFCGTNYLLANHDVLITESGRGRAFEVTREGRIVWEFFNPFRAGEHRELIATLFDVVRLPPDFPLGWVEGAPPLEADARTR